MSRSFSVVVKFLHNGLNGVTSGSSKLSTPMQCLSSQIQGLEGSALQRLERPSPQSSSLEVFPSKRYPRLFGQPVMNPNLDSSEILIQRTFARSSTSSLVSSLTSLIQPLIRRSKTYSTMAEWKSGRSQSLDPPPFLTWLQCWIRIIAVSETKKKNLFHVEEI